MHKDHQASDYEIGYGKPAKSGHFKKGVSGNPSGRPKKPSDFLSALLREANAQMTVNENGKENVVKKIDVVSSR